MTDRECALWLLNAAKEQRATGSARLAEYLGDAASKAAIRHADAALAMRDEVQRCLAEAERQRHYDAKKREG